MTEPIAPAEPAAPRSMAEDISRTVRHEVGNLLQNVYATVGLLQARLPSDWAVEHRILADLKRAAQDCKRLLDGIHDLVCPVVSAEEPIDLANLAATLTAAAQSRHPNLELRAESAGAAPVLADPQHMTQVAELLLSNACEAARRSVRFRTAADPTTGAVEWTIWDDGPGVPAELKDRLFTPFFTTRPGHAGLGLALARKLVLVYGGEIMAGNLGEGGFQARVIFHGRRQGEPQ